MATRTVTRTATGTIAERVVDLLADPAAHADWPSVADRIAYDVFGRTRQLATTLWEKIGEAQAALDDPLAIPGLLDKIAKIAETLKSAETAVTKVGMLSPSDRDLILDLCDQVDEALADASFAVSDWIN